MSGQDGYEEQFEGDESPAVRGSAGQTASWMTRIWATPFHIFSPLKLPQNLQRTVGLWPIITIDSEGFFFIVFTLIWDPRLQTHVPHWVAIDIEFSYAAPIEPWLKSQRAKQRKHMETP